MAQEPESEVDLPKPMTPEARRHKRIILAVMLVFCAIPVLLIFLRLGASETP